ncbi:hypothetical protein BC777_1085 [Yoonia maricola]|uniref:Uncharacterized protein n=1 Tax=Yoonia maricola TaxID=420999 RepID=A0A2M8WMT5_9RHOB|nr:hypothetical protein BC777_1085 [Yoonia maricola]
MAFNAFEEPIHDKKLIAVYLRSLYVLLKS